jgi:hypothetical protein
LCQSNQEKGKVRIEIAPINGEKKIDEGRTTYNEQINMLCGYMSAPDKFNESKAHQCCQED